MSFNYPERRNVYLLNTISDRKGDKMRSMNQNVPQNGLIKKCSSGSRIPGSQFFPGLYPVCHSDPAAYMTGVTCRQWTMSGHCMIIEDITSIKGWTACLPWQCTTSSVPVVTHHIMLEVRRMVCGIDGINTQLTSETRGGQPEVLPGILVTITRMTWRWPSPTFRSQWWTGA